MTMLGLEERRATGRRAWKAHAPQPARSSPSDKDLLAELYRAHGLGARSRQRAARLVEQTGSIGAALSSPVARLRHLGASLAEIEVLHLVSSAVSLSLKRPVEERPLLSSLSSVIDYLHVEMAYRTTEEFRVLFVNGRLRLIHDEIMAIGSIGSVEVHPRTVITRALEVNASNLLLVHNHPSGDPSPTRDDIQLTARIRNAALPLDIRVLDHVVIARSGHVSLRAQGLM